MAKKPDIIFLVGELPLVQEFGELCHHHGFTVTCKLNSKARAASLPNYFKQVTAVPRNISLAIELTNTDREQKRKNLQLLDKSVAGSLMILSSSVTVSASEQSTWIQHRERLTGVSAFPTFFRHNLVEVAPSIYTDRAVVSRVQDFFIKLGKKISVIQDRVGMVMPRILCMIINEAFFALMEGIASPQDIDTAMKLGASYPSGPVELGENVGLQQVCAVLQALHDDIGEERYRTAPLLKQLAYAAR